MNKELFPPKTTASPTQYHNLKTGIAALLQSGRQQAAKQINTVLLHTYWHIGKYVVEFEQNGEDRAKYGDRLLATLAKDLTLEYGKGFSRSNLTYMRKFFLTFPKSETVSHKLTWSHYFEILKIDDTLEQGFYIKQCENENWSVRELKRQMKSALYQRIALSKDKKEVLDLSKQGQSIQAPEDIIKDPYVFEFLGIPQQEKYLEGELEAKLVTNLETFLLELGKGFAFIGRQYKISIAGKHYFVDLVFYHRILKCFVLIDLKRGEIAHQDIGQMNLYLNYFQKEENQADDNAPIGLVLGAYKDNILMEYATANITNQLFVSKYQLYLPNKEVLQKELEKLLNNE